VDKLTKFQAHPAGPANIDVDPVDSAFYKLAHFFKTVGCGVAYEGDRVITATKGMMVLDFRVMENKNIAHVTSGPKYRPDKAGTKESGAIINKGRDYMKSRNLLRITITGQQSIPVFLELRKNLPDPEHSICQAVLLVLRLAMEKESDLRKQLLSTEHMKDVPQEWLPSPGTVQKFPELEDFVGLMARENKLPGQSSGELAE
jgi:hypothetical protein